MMIVFINQSESINQSVGRVGCSFVRSVGLVSQSVGQSVKSVSQSVCLSVYHLSINLSVSKRGSTSPSHV